MVKTIQAVKFFTMTWLWSLKKDYSRSNLERADFGITFILVFIHPVIFRAVNYLIRVKMISSCSPLAPHQTTEMNSTDQNQFKGDNVVNLFTSWWNVIDKLVFRVTHDFKNSRFFFKEIVSHSLTLILTVILGCINLECHQHFHASVHNQSKIKRHNSNNRLLDKNLHNTMLVFNYWHFLDSQFI